jgi:hypothetical protein
LVEAPEARLAAAGSDLAAGRVEVWEKLQDVVLTPGTPDSVAWRRTADGVYTAASAYAAQFICSQVSSTRKMIPKIKHKGLIALTQMVWWSFWNERNKRIFHAHEDSMASIIATIL